MSTKLTTKQEETLAELSGNIAAELAGGADREQIVRELIKQNWPKESALQFVESVEEELRRYKESPEGKKELAEQYARHMLYGLLWAAGGTIVTIGSYTTVSESGGTYVIAYGAILYGIIDFFRGFFSWLTNRA